MKIIVYLIILSCLAISNKTMAQCPGTIQFKTSDMSNGLTQLPLPLKFEIGRDSVVVKTADAKQEIFSAFKILNKQCKCNEDFSTGSMIYSLELNESEAKFTAILTIKLNNKKGKIELLYKNSEPRIFTIQN